MILTSLILFAATVVAPAVPPPVTLIKAGRLIDGTGRPPLDNVTIVVRGEVIESVQRGAVNPDLQRGARVIDLSKETVLPGLMDCHDHITGTPGDGGDTQMLQVGQRITPSATLAKIVQPTKLKAEIKVAETQADRKSVV